METTRYKLKLAGVAGKNLAKGEKEIDPRIFENTPGFIDALLDLAQQAGYAIRWGEEWQHPKDSNFSPLEDEYKVIKGCIEYGPHEQSMLYKIDVDLVKVF